MTTPLQSNILEEWESPSGALCRIIESPFVWPDVSMWLPKKYKAWALCVDYANLPDISWTINGEITLIGSSDKSKVRNKFIEEARKAATKAGNEWLPDFLTKENDD